MLTGAILLPALILAAAAIGAWRTTSVEAERELAVAAEGAAEFALRVIEGHGRIAARIAESLAGETDAEILGAAEALRDRISRFVDDLPLVTGIVVTGAQGDILVHTAWAGLSDGTPPDLAAAHLAPAGEGVMLGGPILPSAGAAPVFVVAQPRLEGEGVIAILLDANETGAGLRRVLGPGGDSAALVRADGRILARHPPYRAPPPPLGADKPLIAALAAGQTQGRIEGETPRDGRAVLVRFRTLARHPTIAVAAARPWAEIAANWWSAMLPLLLIGVPAIAALGALAWLVRGKQRALEESLAQLEQRVAERTESLREQEERLRLAVGAARAGTWETELDTGRTTRSPLALQIMGLPADGGDWHTRDWADRLHPLDRPAAERGMRDMGSGRIAEFSFQYRFQRPDGAWRWLDSAAAVVRADPATGRPLRIAGTIQDITERREAEERRELLTQEVNHRARNTLAIVQAILRLTRAKDAATYARLVEGRIAALARAQSLLAAERWTGAPITTLLTDELAPFGEAETEAETGRGRFILRGDPLRLRAEAVQPLGMVFHELATNAAKHGALAREEGRVRVEWQADEAEGRLRIRWTETGGPPPGMPSHRGVGSRVIETTVNGQLGGHVDRRWPDEGLVCEIIVPLTSVRAGPA